MNSISHCRKAHRTDVTPCWAGAERGQAKHSSDGSGIDSRLVRTVLVDDSPFILKTLSSLLETQEGFQVIGTATDGHHALRRVVELQPDLVLMGLQLPGISGLELTRQMKARSPAPVVILVTSDVTTERRTAARAAGTASVIGKRNLASQLRRVIRKLFPTATI